jgi:hypothetical protein
MPSSVRESLPGRAQRWLDEVTTSQVTGAHVDPKTARTTVAEWCST